MSDSFDTLVTLGEQIEAILEERDRLREALKQIDVIAEAGRRIDEGIAACDDIRAKVRAALATSSGESLKEL
jgi:hypothetical protein